MSRNSLSLLQHRYADYPGHASLVFDSICRTLTGHLSEVDWTSFTGEDWRLLAVMAKTEGVAPLLYDAFKRSNVQTFQRSNVLTFNALQKEYYATAARNELLLRELDRVLDALNAADIPAILLKGAALAQTLYPDPALRPMSDLDVLVPFEEIDHTVQAVHDLGYRNDSVSYWPSLNRVLGHHEHLQNQAGANLELHWSLTQVVNGDHTLTAWFWKNTQLLQEQRIVESEHSHRFGFSGVHTLSPTRHFLYLSSHLFLQHGAARGLLLWLYDLHLLLTTSGEGIDWDVLIAQSRELGWGAAVAAALFQLRVRFQTEYPPEIMDALNAHQDARGQRLVYEKSQPDQSRARAWWRGWQLLNWRERFAYSLGNFFPSPAFIRQRYDPKPAWLWPLYYPYRWGSQTGDIMATLGRLIRGRLW